MSGDASRPALVTAKVVEQNLDHLLLIDRPPPRLQGRTQLRVPMRLGRPSHQGLADERGIVQVKSSLLDGHQGLIQQGALARQQANLES